MSSSVKGSGFTSLYLGSSQRHMLQALRKSPEQRPSASALLSHLWLSAYSTPPPSDPPPHPSDPLSHPSDPIYHPSNPHHSIAALQHCVTQPLITSCQSSISFDRNPCSAWQSPPEACLSPHHKHASPSGLQCVPHDRQQSAAAATDAAAQSRAKHGPISNTAAKHAHTAATASGVGDNQRASHWETCNQVSKERLAAGDQERDMSDWEERGKLGDESATASNGMATSCGHDSSWHIEAFTHGQPESSTGQVCSTVARPCYVLLTVMLWSSLLP